MIFTLNKDEIKKALEFINNHKCSIRYTGVIGGKITYLFTPNNVGCLIKVRCACGQELDLTDYEF